MQSNIENMFFLVDYAQQLKKEQIKPSFLYDVESLRPIYADSGNRLYEGSLSPQEVEFAKNSVYVGFTKPIWVKSSLAEKMHLKTNFLSKAIYHNNALILNCDQISDYSQLVEQGIFVKPSEFKSIWTPDSDLENAINNKLEVGVFNQHNCLFPFTNVNLNFIYMPPQGAYADSLGYYQNLFHELSHNLLNKENESKEKQPSSILPREKHEVYSESCAYLLTLNAYIERHREEVSTEKIQDIMHHSAKYLVSWKLFDQYPDKKALDEFCKDVSSFADKVTEQLTQAIEQTHFDPEPNNNSSIFLGSNKVKNSKMKFIDVDPETYNRLSQQGVLSCFSSRLSELGKDLESQISYQVKQKQAEHQKPEELNKNAPSDNRLTLKSKALSSNLER